MRYHFTFQFVIKEYILQGRAAVFASLLGTGKLVAVERKNDDAERYVTVT